MSGIEVAGLAIGILPIVIEILKSYSATKDRLHTFMHHVQVAKDVKLRYLAVASSFKNECQLLLKAVVDDPRELSEMVEQPTHSIWEDPLLEERFHSFLDRDKQLFEEIVVHIRNVLRETQTRLAELRQDYDSQSTRRRLYQDFNIALKENQYGKWLKELNQWNKKLGRLRSQRCKLQKNHSYRTNLIFRKSVPKRYADIRTASQTLHESMQESWSCTNISHVDHKAKLSLEAEAECGIARLDIAIACRRIASVSGQRTPSEPPIWLHVQSITSSNVKSVAHGESPALVNALSASIHAAPSPPNHTASRPRVQVVKNMLKRVRFEDPSDSNRNSPRSLPKTGDRAIKEAQKSQAVSFVMQDLKATESVCCHLSKACSSDSSRDPCLGYLEFQVHRPFKFVFYDAGRNTKTQVARSTSYKESLTVDHMLRELQILHQLSLAHKLATTILQYNSTAWLREDWGLNDVSCFITPGQSTVADITQTLQTLHLSTQFPPVSSEETVASGKKPENMKHVYGIRNMTLAKLGVALLEIGLKKGISSISVEVTPHSVINARKLLEEESSSLASLGKRYVAIVKRCVDCDFSAGEDLSEENLQSAFYTEVVCALEDMIADWKRFRGIK